MFVASGTTVLRQSRMKPLLRGTYLRIIGLDVIDRLLILAVCLPAGPKFLHRVAAEIFVGCVEQPFKEDIAVGTRVGRTDIRVFKRQQLQFVFTFGALGFGFVFKSSGRLKVILN
jgi:hypothetical protein